MHPYITLFDINCRIKLPILIWELLVRPKYNVISIGEPDQKYFDDRSKNLTVACRHLGLRSSFFSILRLNIILTIKFKSW